jgi:hypothetical protein
MSISPPISVAQFQAQFDRDFTYGTGTDTVRTSDIVKAFGVAWANWNASLFTQDEAPIAYGYLAAHFLVLNIQGAGGLNPLGPHRGTNSRGGGVIQSKSVGDVTVNFQVPDMIAKSRILSQLYRTDYGQQFLQMALPRIVGHIFVAQGRSGFGLASGGGGLTNPLVISTAALANAVAGVPFTQTLQAAGGVVPLVWSLLSGSLPAGMSLASNGVLSGTTSSPGTFYFTVQVMDGNGNVAMNNFQWTVT